jgi:hypothetical protein
VIFWTKVYNLLQNIPFFKNRKKIKSNRKNNFECLKSFFIKMLKQVMDENMSRTISTFPEPAIGSRPAQSDQVGCWTFAFPDSDSI